MSVNDKVEFVLQSSSIKLLIIAQYFPPDVGGATTRVSNIVKGLKDRCKIVVITAYPHYPHGEIPQKYKGKIVVPEKEGKIKIYRVWIPPLPHNSIVNRIILHLSFILSALCPLFFIRDFDVVWAANPNLFSFFPAMVYGFFYQKPIIRNVDDLWPEVFYELGLVESKLIRRVLDFIARLSYSVPEAITPISNGYKQWIIDKYNIDKEKIHVIEVGVDNVQPLIYKGSDKNQFTVMYSGALGLGYDFNIIIKAANLLKSQKDIVFIIRGRGEKAEKLRKKIEELNLDNVVLNTSFLPEKELFTLLRSANIFVLPMIAGNFIDKGLPTKIFEYQSYGKPIICISKGEPARYIRKTNSGIVVESDDEKSLAEAVMKVYDDKEYSYRLGSNGWKYVLNNLTTKKIGSRFLRIIIPAICNNK